MQFRHLTVYQLTQPMGVEIANLESLLAANPFRPCGTLEMHTEGWVPPMGEPGKNLVHAGAKAMLMALAIEEKVIPSSTVRDKVADKVAEMMEADPGRVISSKEKKEIREQIEHAMLPHAPTRRRVTYGYLDLDHGRLVINESTSTKTSSFTSALRTALGSLPVAPIKPAQAPAGLMTEWLSKQDVPADFQLLEDAVLKDVDGEGGSITLRKQDLLSDEVRSHLDGNKIVAKLGLAFRDRLSFALDANLVITRLKLSDVTTESLIGIDDADGAALFDAEFHLMVAEYRNLIEALAKTFGVASMDGEDADMKEAA